jgi:hypothetical protein
VRIDRLVEVGLAFVLGGSQWPVLAQFALQAPGFALRGAEQPTLPVAAAVGLVVHELRRPFFISPRAR